MITAEEMNKMFPGSDKFSEAINTAIEHFDINNPAMFIAQMGHESGGFKILVENLNYSANRLLQIFPKYFDKASAAIYARQPQRIANRIYAKRMGNGDEASGDGWKYRGKGAIQITGKNNHKLFSDYMKISLDEAVQYMLTTEGAILSAAWFWKTNNINEISDSVIKTTLKINGGSNGLDDRRALYDKAIKIFA
jgi:putative chitinase